MKKFLLTMILAVVFFSCQKNDVTPAGSTVQYTVQTKDSVIFPSTGTVTYQSQVFTVGEDTANIFVAKNTYSKTDTAYYYGQITTIFRLVVSCSQ